MLFHKKVMQVESLHESINQSVFKSLHGNQEDEMEIIEIHPDQANDSDYIKEVPEEFEQTTRFTGSILGKGL